jgi:hypothetical protein
VLTLGIVGIVMFGEIPANAQGLELDSPSTATPTSFEPGSPIGVEFNFAIGIGGRSLALGMISVVLLDSDGDTSYKRP